ncbi:AraC family transcriptional regulator [Bradyrhizobium sp. RT9b]|uniref:helix-turn-helix transcriptional regulator n=1 Tax=Bradyrhizobium sp. RT9b TaxID=3156385 RepID=UPI003395A909
MEQAAYQILRPVVHERWLPEFLTLKVAELLYLGLDAMLPNVEGPEFEETLQSKIFHARSMLDDSLQSPPSQSDLARLVGLPVAVFSAAFRDVIGMAIPQYLNHRRMHKARMLIENTTMPLKQIAHEAGYNHTSNLCLALKRHFGKTAREIRTGQRRRDARSVACPREGMAARDFCWQLASPS